LRTETVAENIPIPELKLTEEQRKQLEITKPVVERLKRQMLVFKEAGLDTADLERQINRAEALTTGLLENF
jgi:hypothetical protein